MFNEFLIPPQEKAGKSERKVERTLDTEKQPEFKYYYHGTFAGNLPAMLEGGFNFKQGRPTVSSSPRYCLDNWTTLEKLKERGREAVKENDEGMLLVIEPSDHSMVPSRDGMPEKIDEKTIHVHGRWFNYHQAMVKEGIPVGTPSKLSPEQIKMALLPSPEFKKIFSDFRAALSRGEDPEDDFILRLAECLKNGESVLVDKIGDKQELAENMIVGEVQQYIIESLRKLSLNLEHYKGKKIVQGGKREDFKPWSEKKVQQVIGSLKQLDPTNKFLKRYIELNLPALERGFVDLSK